jgi:hypothetical protein
VSFSPIFGKAINGNAPLLPAKTGLTSPLMDSSAVAIEGIVALRYVQAFKNIRYLYWKWADLRTFAQFVQNTSPGNTVQRDTIKIYTTAWEIS